MEKINSILIPSYNPDNNLVILIEELIKNNFTSIIVVNDGSNSNYIFEKIKDKCTILNHNTNLGKGIALKTGFNYILNNISNSHGVITVDADGQHKIEDIIKIDKILSETNSVIIGVRTFDKKVPLRSKIGNFTSKKLFKLLFKYNISDTQTGLRGIPNMLLKDLILLKGNRYEYEINCLIYFVKSKVNIIEEKIKTVYIDNNKKSHFKALSDSIRIYNIMIKNILE